MPTVYPHLVIATSVPSGDVVLALAHVRRSFGSAVALADLSFEAPAGSVTVLLGPNGAGKTTALRVVTGALAPDAGAVRVFGLDPCSAADGEAVRLRCGVVAAKPALYDRLSGRDNLRYAAELFDVDRADARIEDAAGRFGIERALDAKVGGYSTGMKTRLALARSILHDPDLLLLDEPTSGLDPESSTAVLRLIDEMAADGKTVLMSTHLLLEAEGLADQIVLMEAGRDVVSGAPDELVHRYWPHPQVLFDAEERTALDGLQAMDGVVDYHRNGDGGAVVSLDRLERVPDLVARLALGGVRLTCVAPQHPSLEQLYRRVRSAA